MFTEEVAESADKHFNAIRIHSNGQVVTTWWTCAVIRIRKSKAFRAEVEYEIFRSSDSMRRADNNGIGLEILDMFANLHCRVVHQPRLCLSGGVCRIEF
ncbi:hypothetical protein P5673_012934 [Acropora cervicornis]|uniref:Uncharacterized protein n=1 Tax=Acropora cervicornis TaxID=6130 RepID=A0AAD9QMM0_ACRCE|nr:hypothetical protein P5673_012934 [Acropora cervicornis]